MGILYWDVKHAQSFGADRHISDLHHESIFPSQGHFQKQKPKNTTNSCYKVHYCLYNIYEQHRLLVLRQDCFHIKNVQKEITSTHSFICSGPLVEFIHFFSE